MGFTHVELMPVAEHPFGGSWGYQVSGYYAPDGPVRHAGRILRQLVDALHQRRDRGDRRLGARPFPAGRSSLWPASTAPRSTSTRTPAWATHPDWGTLVFNFGRNEVRNFLVANALYWMERFHVDGLRVDAVASMLYLDYSRKAGRVVAQPSSAAGRTSRPWRSSRRSTRRSTPSIPGRR